MLTAERLELLRKLDTTDLDIFALEVAVAGGHGVVLRPGRDSGDVEVGSAVGCDGEVLVERRGCLRYGAYSGRASCRRSCCSMHLHSVAGLSAFLLLLPMVLVHEL